MIDIKIIESFLVKARTKTYASGSNKVNPVLNGSDQLEYKENNWLYRDVYYTGKNTFYGIETVFSDNEPIFGMSYFGNWGDMTEKEIDNILRGALTQNPETRLYKKIDWQKNGFEYLCTPDLVDGIKEIGGTEIISKNGKQIYVLYYAGSILTEKI